MAICLGKRVMELARLMKVRTVVAADRPWREALS
jgi:hypothetical protein